MQAKVPTAAEAEAYLQYIAFSGNLIPNCVTANEGQFPNHPEYVGSNIDSSNFLAYGFFNGLPLYHGTGNTAWNGNEIF